MKVLFEKQGPAKPLSQIKATKPKPGETWTEPLTGMEFVWVPGGCYHMGCGSWTDNCNYDEKPVHVVCVDGFWIGKYEVTVDQYRQFLQATGDTDGVSWRSKKCPIKKDESFPLSGNEMSQQGEHPMVTVEWDGARVFAKWLSRKTGKNFRLPTEAEWEYAARSGGKEQKYAGGEDVDKVAWYGEDYESGSTHKVGMKAPNGLGIYDMSGNAKEWCEDMYYSKAYSRHSKNNPVITSNGNRRVHRGGSWSSDPWGVRTTARISLAQRLEGDRYIRLKVGGRGFRLCLPQSGD